MLQRRVWLLTSPPLSCLCLGESRCPRAARPLVPLETSEEQIPAVSPHSSAEGPLCCSARGVKRRRSPRGTFSRLRCVLCWILNISHPSKGLGVPVKQPVRSVSRTPAELWDSNLCLKPPTTGPFASRTPAAAGRLRPGAPAGAAPAVPASLPLRLLSNVLRKFLRRQQNWDSCSQWHFILIFIRCLLECM